MIQFSMLLGVKAVTTLEISATTGPPEIVPVTYVYAHIRVYTHSSYLR